MQWSPILRYTHTLIFDAQFIMYIRYVCSHVGSRYIHVRRNIVFVIFRIIMCINITLLPHNLYLIITNNNRVYLYYSIRRYVKKYLRLCSPCETTKNYYASSADQLVFFMMYTVYGIPLAMLYCTDVNQGRN